jgi:alpha-galactosidase
MRIATDCIQVNENKLEFHLTNNKISYVFRVIEDSKQLEHLYFGNKIHHMDSFAYLIEREERPSNNLFQPDELSSFEHIKQEYPSFGTTDFRYPAFEIENPLGDRVSHLQYNDYKILKGKPKLKGLPATYTEEDNEAATLVITLKDQYANIFVELFYTIFIDRPLISRYIKFINKSDSSINIANAMSMSLDLSDRNFDFIHLNGAWARENHFERKPLISGVQSISSTRGASSHVHNPFMALARPNADENNGEVYGFSLVYSGNHIGQVEVDTYDVTRVTMGINPFRFNWELQPDDSFQTPEAIMVYSDSGLNKMSQTFHDLYKNRLVRGEWRDKTRPILINNWEATYFDFNEEKILEIAKKSSELGIELFVLDDGWFEGRNDDTTSLGNWSVDKEKLPNGIADLSEKIHNLGLKFGLWFEPEMISMDTPLYEQHPEWLIHVPGKNISHGRNQFVLDFSRSEVVDDIFKQIDNILRGSKVDYIKWDMNRYISEGFSSQLSSDNQGEIYHRYILGVYSLFEKIIEKYPEILIESCAGGGGRFDPGMLYYAPQTWTSDDTDAVERLKIQYGTSMVYPLSSIGSHVSDIPNHQVGRETNLDMRSSVAYFGTFGYELDITDLSLAEKNKISEQIEFFKGNRELIHNGDFYRLISPFDNNQAAWMVVSKNKDEALIGYYKVLNQPNPSYERLKLKGLDPDKQYIITQNGEERFGADLMNVGLMFSKNFTTRQSDFWKQNRGHDYSGRIIHLRENVN